MKRLRTLLIVILCLSVASCTSQGSKARQKISISPKIGVSSGKTTKKSPPTSSQNLEKVAVIDGVGVRWSQFKPALIEAAGSQVLAELILGNRIRQKLGNQPISQEQIDAERFLFLTSLDADPARAEKLLVRLRQREGLGTHRFKAFLQRQAGLRLLVDEKVQISEVAAQQAYQIEYGPTRDIRLITVSQATEAEQIILALQRGENFTDLVQKYSTDASHTSGGWINAISPLDPSYPTALRKAMMRLSIGEHSDIIALEHGFAVLRLEQKNTARLVAYEDVRQALTQRLRREIQQFKMRQLAVSLLRDAKVTVLDAQLHQNWKAYVGEIQSY